MPVTPSSASTCMIMRAPLIRAPASGWTPGRASGAMSLRVDVLMDGVLRNLLGVAKATELSSLTAWVRGANSRRSLYSAKAFSRARPDMRHIIAIQLQNEAGALTRVAGLFSTRGYNIESLSV